MKVSSKCNDRFSYRESERFGNTDTQGEDRHVKEGRD
jgi:hypothetical protein